MLLIGLYMQQSKLNYKQKYSHKDRLCPMSNVDASEENVESPSAYGGQAYIEYRKKEKKRRGKKK
jgi:hypothetical protein